MIISHISTTDFNKSAFKAVELFVIFGKGGGRTAGPNFWKALSQSKQYFDEISSGIGIEKNKPEGLNWLTFQNFE